MTLQVKLMYITLNNESGKFLVEDKVNTYLREHKDLDIKDVNVNCERVFLPQTDRGEFQNNWTVTILYDDNKKEKDDK